MDVGSESIQSVTEFSCDRLKKSYKVSKFLNRKDTVIIDQAVEPYQFDMKGMLYNDGTKTEDQYAEELKAIAERDIVFNDIDFVGWKGYLAFTDVDIEKSAEKLNIREYDGEGYFLPATKNKRVMMKNNDYILNDWGLDFVPCFEFANNNFIINSPIDSIKGGYGILTTNGSNNIYSMFPVVFASNMVNKLYQTVNFEDHEAIEFKCSYLSMMDEYIEFASSIDVRASYNIPAGNYSIRMRIKASALYDDDLRVVVYDKEDDTIQYYNGYVTPTNIVWDMIETTDFYIPTGRSINVRIYKGEGNSNIRINYVYFNPAYTPKLEFTPSSFNICDGTSKILYDMYELTTSSVVSAQSNNMKFIFDNTASSTNGAIKITSNLSETDVNNYVKINLPYNDLFEQTIDKVHPFTYSFGNEFYGTGIHHRFSYFVDFNSMIVEINSKSDSLTAGCGDLNISYGNSDFALLDSTNRVYFSDGFKYFEVMCTDGRFYYVVDPTLNMLKKIRKSDKAEVAVEYLSNYGIGNCYGISEVYGCPDFTVIFMTDYDNSRVVAINKSDLSFATSIGSLGSGDFQFNQPIGISVIGGAIFVSDSNNSRIAYFYYTTSDTDGMIFDGFDATFYSLSTTSLGGNPFALCGAVDESYNLYIFYDANDNYLHKCTFTNMDNTLVHNASTASTNNFDYLCSDATNVYIVNGAYNKVMKYLCSDLSFVSENDFTSGYIGGDLPYVYDHLSYPVGICIDMDVLYDEEYGIYYSKYGSTFCFGNPNTEELEFGIWQVNCSDLSYVDKFGKYIDYTAVENGLEYVDLSWMSLSTLCVDDNYIYIYNNDDGIIIKLNKNDLSYACRSNNIYIDSLQTDGTYVYGYYLGGADPCLYMFRCSDLNCISMHTFDDDINNLVIDGEYLYISYGSENIQKRLLSDFSLVVTSPESYNEIYSMCTDDDYLYIMSNDWIHRLSKTDLTQNEDDDSVDISNYSTSASPNWIINMSVYGDKIYLSPYYTPEIFNYSMVIIDKSDFSLIEEKVYTDFNSGDDGPYSIKCSDGIAYITFGSVDSTKEIGLGKFLIQPFNVYSVGDNEEKFGSVGLTNGIMRAKNTTELNNYLVFKSINEKVDTDGGVLSTSDPTSNTNTPYTLVIRPFDEYSSNATDEFDSLFKPFSVTDVESSADLEFPSHADLFLDTFTVNSLDRYNDFTTEESAIYTVYGDTAPASSMATVEPTNGRVRFDHTVDTTRSLLVKDCQFGDGEYEADFYYTETLDNSEIEMGFVFCYADDRNYFKATMKPYRTSDASSSLNIIKMEDGVEINCCSTSFASDHTYLHTQFPSSQWMKFKLVKEGKKMNFWIDGVSVGTGFELDPETTPTNANTFSDIDEGSFGLYSKATGTATSSIYVSNFSFNSAEFSMVETLSGDEVGNKYACVNPSHSSVTKDTTYLKMTVDSSNQAFVRLNTYQPANGKYTAEITFPTEGVTGDQIGVVLYAEDPNMTNGLKVGFERKSTGSWQLMAWEGGETTAFATSTESTGMPSNGDSVYIEIFNDNDGQFSVWRYGTMSTPEVTCLGVPTFTFNRDKYEQRGYCGFFFNNVSTSSQYVKIKSIRIKTGDPLLICYTNYSWADERVGSFFRDDFTSSALNKYTIESGTFTPSSGALVCSTSGKIINNMFFGNESTHQFRIKMDTDKTCYYYFSEYRLEMAQFPTTMSITLKNAAGTTQIGDKWTEVVSANNYLTIRIEQLAAYINIYKVDETSKVKSLKIDYSIEPTELGLSPYFKLVDRTYLDYWQILGKRPYYRYGNVCYGEVTGSFYNSDDIYDNTATLYYDSYQFDTSNEYTHGSDWTFSTNEGYVRAVDSDSSLMLKTLEWGSGYFEVESTTDASGLSIVLSTSESTSQTYKTGADKYSVLFLPEGAYIYRVNDEEETIVGSCTTCSYDKTERNAFGVLWDRENYIISVYINGVMTANYQDTSADRMDSYMYFGLSGNKNTYKVYSTTINARLKRSVMGKAPAIYSPAHGGFYGSDEKLELNMGKLTETGVMTPYTAILCPTYDGIALKHTFVQNSVDLVEYSSFYSSSHGELATVGVTFSLNDSAHDLIWEIEKLNSSAFNFPPHYILSFGLMYSDGSFRFVHDSDAQKAILAVIKKPSTTWRIEPKR